SLLQPSLPRHDPSASSSTNARPPRSAGRHRPISAALSAGSSPDGRSAGGAYRSRTSSVTSGGVALDGARLGSGGGVAPGRSRAVTSPSTSMRFTPSGPGRNATARAIQSGVPGSHPGPEEANPYPTHIPAGFAVHAPQIRPHSDHQSKSTGDRRSTPWSAQLGSSTAQTP